MKSAAPALTFGSLLLAAVLVAGGGLTLARREHTTHAPSDRKALLVLADDLQKELRRLENVYERDLSELAEAIDPSNTVHAQQLIRNVHGVRACTILRRRAADDPVTVKTSAGDKAIPMVTLKPALRSDQVPASESRVFDNERDQGWGVIESRDPFDFYVRRISPEIALVLIVDARELEDVTRSHLATWTGRRLDPAKARDEIDRLESPHGQTVRGTSTPPAGRSADFAIPVTSRLGAWNILSWDRMITTHSFHAPTLVVSTALAAALMLAGILLSRAQHRAQRLAEQRVSFVNRVSHELGTPLTNMLLNLDLAREMIDGAPESAKQRLALVEEETRRLARLTANVLTFSRSERGSLQVNLTPCVPDDVLARVLDHFTPALERRGITAGKQFHADITVVTDPDALAQVAANLISNVEKHAASGGSLEIASAIEGAQLIVRVSDRGPGIPESERERIFHPFERLRDQVNEGSSGAGLGLSIARDLAQRMGGSLSMVGSEHGSVFELRVPCASPEADNSARESDGMVSSPRIEATA